jgi:pentatricopeptide repeat protein
MLPYNSTFNITALFRYGRRCRICTVAPSVQSRRAVLPFSPDAYTFPLLLKDAAASARGSPLEGQKLHALVIKFGFSSGAYTSTALINFYAKVGDLASAREVFDAMPCRTLPSWTAIMVGHARCGDMRSAMEVFLSMPEKDNAVYNAMMDGFVKVGDVQSARRVFDVMPEWNVVSWTCLMHGYCISGNMEAARDLFDAMPQRNMYSWNVMISGYC